MRIFAPITDYIRASLLTQQGDIVVRGGTVPQRQGINVGLAMLCAQSGGTLLTYRKQGTFLRDNELSAENAGLVTVTNIDTTIKTLDLGTVGVGDRFMVNGYAGGVKTTTGTFLLAIQKDSGTGVVQAYHDLPYVSHTIYCPDSLTIYNSICGILKVTTAGTMVLKLNGLCSVGSLAVNAGTGQIYVMQIAW